MTEEQLLKLHELFRAANRAKEKADAYKAWAEENVIDGYFKIPIDSKYFGRFTLEEKCLKLPAKMIYIEMKKARQEANKLQAEFDNIRVTFE